MRKKQHVIFTAFIVFGILFCLNFIYSRKQERRLWIPTSQQDSVYLYGDKYALMVGIDDYADNQITDLENAISDVVEVSKVLKKLGFRVEIMRNPSFQELRGRIKGLPYTEYGQREDSALLLYFAGHGFTETLVDKTKLGYFAPRDCPNPEKDKGKAAEMAISMNEIVELATRLKNRHVLCVFDSCFSGSLFNIMRALPVPIMDNIALPVRQFIAAGRENEFVPDVSIFKKVFLEGIQGQADFNQDGFVTATELGSWLASEVEQYSNGVQHPQFGKINNPNLNKGDFVFTVPGRDINVFETPSPGGAIIYPNARRWYIYQDADSKINHGVWTNWMPKNAKEMISLGFVDEQNPASGSSAIQISVEFREPNWCGVAVAVFENYWGETPSDFAYNLSRAQRLIFHARGANGGEMIQVKVAVAGDKPYGDSARRPAESHWITLTDRWQEYEISLEGIDLSRVITPFCFVTDKAHNRSNNITFYLDEICFVME